MFWMPQHDHAQLEDEIVFELKRNLWNMTENANYMTQSYDNCYPILDENRMGSRCESLDEVMEDFRMNGHDSEYYPEFENKTQFPNNIPYSKYEQIDFNIYAQSFPPISSRPFKRAKIDKRLKRPLAKECVFCKNNGEPESTYTEHCIRDNLGRVLCPVLRTFKCPKCGATGDDAHTIKHCPQKEIIQMQDTLVPLKTNKNYQGKRGKMADINNNNGNFMPNLNINFGF